MKKIKKLRGGGSPKTGRPYGILTQDKAASKLEAKKSQKPSINSEKVDARTKKEKRVDDLNKILKTAAFGSNKRRKIYSAANLKQDATTTGSKVSNLKAKGIKDPSVSKATAETIKVKPKTASNKATNKVADIRKKGNEAISKGNTAKAMRLRKRANRISKRSSK